MRTALVWLLLVAAYAAAAADNLSVLDAVWQAAQEHIQPRSLAESRFTRAAHDQLARQARRRPDLYAFAPDLNRFLDSLGRSHTGFYHDRDLDFYLYRSMFTTRVLDEPRVRHAGIQHQRVDGAWVIREVWDGAPARRAGLRRGDVLLRADGVAYDPYAAFNDSTGPVVVEYRRGRTLRQVRIEPVDANPNRTLLDAMRSSVRADTDGAGHRIGYLHLWAATHPRMLDVYLDGLARLADTDALILDLRGGFGGAWYEYLDPFFADRRGFYQATLIGPDGRQVLAVGERPDVLRYPGPLVVLINEGTRSGKEALAFQFRKSGRATLVGSRTRGAFTAGRGIFTAPDSRYFLLVASAEYLLDGQRIEGVGVPPDVAVSYPLRASAADPQLDRAFDIAARLAADATAQPGPTMRPGSTISSNSAPLR